MSTYVVKKVPRHGERGVVFPFLRKNEGAEERRTGARKKTKKAANSRLRLFFGADYGARTRHLHLGKVALYQMS